MEMCISFPLHIFSRLSQIYLKQQERSGYLINTFRIRQGCCYQDILTTPGVTLAFLIYSVFGYFSLFIGARLSKMVFTIFYVQSVCSEGFSLLPTETITDGRVEDLLRSRAAG